MHFSVDGHEHYPAATFYLLVILERMKSSGKDLPVGDVKLKPLLKPAWECLTEGDDHVDGIPALAIITKRTFMPLLIVTILALPANWRARTPMLAALYNGVDNVECS